MCSSTHLAYLAFGLVISDFKCAPCERLHRFGSLGRSNAMHFSKCHLTICAEAYGVVVVRRNAVAFAQSTCSDALTCVRSNLTRSTMNRVLHAVRARHHNEIVTHIHNQLSRLQNMAAANGRWAYKIEWICSQFYNQKGNKQQKKNEFLLLLLLWYSNSGPH